MRHAAASGDGEKEKDDGAENILDAVESDAGGVQSRPSNRDTPVATPSQYGELVERLRNRNIPDQDVEDAADLITALQSQAEASIAARLKSERIERDTRQVYNDALATIEAQRAEIDGLRIVTIASYIVAGVSLAMMWMALFPIEQKPVDQNPTPMVQHTTEVYV
jgi:hypothetical protein